MLIRYPLSPTQKILITKMVKNRKTPQFNTTWFTVFSHVYSNYFLTCVMFRNKSLNFKVIEWKIRSFVIVTAHAKHQTRIDGPTRWS